MKSFLKFHKNIFLQRILSQELWTHKPLPETYVSLEGTGWSLWVSSFTEVCHVRRHSMAIAWSEDSPF